VSPQGGLEGVLGVVAVRQHPPTDAQDNRAVTAQQGLEGGLLLVGEEATQQLAVGQLAVVMHEGGPADVPDQSVHRARGHVSPSEGRGAH
jgi:hypothetical protein